jgi:hypothetical protein
MNNIDEILNKTIFEYLEEQFKYEIKNHKIKDILVSYNTINRKFDIFNCNKGQKLELFKKELHNFNDINHIIAEYYKCHNLNMPSSLLLPLPSSLPLELQQIIINNKIKSYDNILKNVISRMEIQEEKTKDNILHYILSKLGNQDYIIKNLNEKMKNHKRNYYMSICIMTAILYFNVKYFNNFLNVFIG